MSSSTKVNIHEAKTQFSRLIELVENGEAVVIARHGVPVAELVRAKKPGFPFGIASAEPLVGPGDAWWQPLTPAEADDWLEGR